MRDLIRDRTGLLQGTGAAGHGEISLGCRAIRERLEQTTGIRAGGTFGAHCAVEILLERKLGISETRDLGVKVGGDVRIGVAGQAPGGETG